MKPTETKAGFIRNHPTLSAKEVVERGKASGFDLSTTHVYAVRADDRNKKRKRKKAAKNAAIVAGPPVKIAARSPSIVIAEDAELRLRMLILELGTARAEAAYRKVTSQLKTMVLQ